VDVPLEEIDDETAKGACIGAKDQSAARRLMRVSVSALQVFEVDALAEYAELGAWLWRQLRFWSCLAGRCCLPCYVSIVRGLFFWIAKESN
jgi:hypothetical protein